MTGPSSDPRLLAAAWANEERLADGQTETGQARRHRDEDRDAARTRATATPAGGLFLRIKGLLQRSR